MDAGPWANYAYAVKLQQQQNQFNNSNGVNNHHHLNRNGAIQQSYNLNNFNQNQVYTQNQMESLLAHYNSNNDAAGFANTFNSHHNAYDAELLSNQFQNAAKASLSAAGLFKSKTKENPHCALNNNQLNPNSFGHDANNFLSHHWRHPNLNNLNLNHHDVNNQSTKQQPFGVLPHQTAPVNGPGGGGGVNMQHHAHHSNHKHHHNQYLAQHNELNGHVDRSAKAAAVCSEQSRQHAQLNKINQSNLLPAMMHQNLMQNQHQLNSKQLNNINNNFVESQREKSAKSHHHLPHVTQTADQYLLAMNNQQQMLMKATLNHAQLANQRAAAAAVSNNSHHHLNSHHQNNSSCVIAPNATPSSAVNHMNSFQKNFMHSQNVNNSCLINNNNLMNKAFNNTYCSMVMGGIQINNYNVSNHNNLIISNQSNCAGSSGGNASNQSMNNFLMNNMNSLNGGSNNSSSSNGTVAANGGLLNGAAGMMSNNTSRCSSVASVNNVQQINESSSCSYGFSNSPSFNNTSNGGNNRSTNLSSSQQQLTNNNVPTNGGGGQLNEFTVNYNNSASFPHSSNTPALSSTPTGYPTPPSSVNRSEIMSQHSVQSSSQDEQLMQGHFNQNQQFGNGNCNLISSYNKLTTNQTALNGYNPNNNLPESNNSTNNCLPNLMNITPVSDTMSDTGKLNDSQCSSNAVNLNGMNSSMHNQMDNSSSLQFNEMSQLEQQQQQQTFNQQQQPIVQSKKKKEKVKKKRKKATGQSTIGNAGGNLVNGYYQSATAHQHQYPIYPNNTCNGYFQNASNMQQQQILQFNTEEAMASLQPNDEQLVDNLSDQQHSISSSDLSQQQLQQSLQCMYADSQSSCLVSNLNESNCSNEHDQIPCLMAPEQEHLIANNTLEDKLACLEDDLKYLTESNECMLDKEAAELNNEAAYTSDHSNNNSSLDEPLMHQQLGSEQASLNGSMNNAPILSHNGSMSGSIKHEQSPIDDLNRPNYESGYEESNSDYVNIAPQHPGKRLKEDPDCCSLSEDKKGRKKKKKERTTKAKVLSTEALNGCQLAAAAAAETAVELDSQQTIKKSKSTAKLSDSSFVVNSSISSLPLKNSLDNLDNKISMNHSILNKKNKPDVVKKDEYEFTDEFAPLDCVEQSATGGKKRKKVNCENVNKKTKPTNSLNEGLIKSFNSSKDKKEEKQLAKSKTLKILTSKSQANLEFKKNNSVETSSTTSSSSSTSFSLTSKKENQQDLVGSNNNNNGAIVINSKSASLSNKNQNVVQIGNSKKIITGKNINNQLESKKNEISILSEPVVKADRKSVDSLTNGSTAGKSGEKSLKQKVAKRRSSEKKVLTVREGLMRTSDFVISKDAIERGHSVLWRIEGKSLLQLFKPVEENGSLFYQNTSSYSAWNPTLREKYVGVDVRIMGCSRTKITVEKLSINKSSASLEDKLLNDAKDDCFSNSLFSPAQHSTNFAVYMQTLISQILDPHFIKEIIEENDEYFINHIQKIDEYCLSKKAKIYSKVKWETSIIKCVETYPKCEVVAQDNSGDLRCKFCYEKWSTQILNFTGDMYDPTTLEHIDSGELKLNKYAACEPCKIKVMALSNLLHQKYNFYVRCGEKVEELREGDETKKCHVILEQCLQDSEWIDSLFRELKEIWNSADKLF